MLSQDHARLIVEIFRKVLIMIENVIKDDIKIHKEELDEIEKLHSRSLEIRRMMMKELHETGGMLVNREDLYRLFSKSGEVTDHIKGIGVRLWEMEERTWKIPKVVEEGLVRMSEVALETLTKLRESLIILGFDSNQAIVLAREVDEGERKVDAIYREVDLDIITSGAELPIILLLRDIIGMIENIIDKAEEMADFIRIIAL
jgi:uncharacterized protein Yka (UPF0111/DUF47 family)